MTSGNYMKITKPVETEKKWHLIDAKGQVLGRVATKVATLLKGKHKPEYFPGADNGDFVVVVNAKEVAVTGGKEKKKKYYSHTGYPGGIKEMSFEYFNDRKPGEPVRHAVRGMLSKNPLGRRMLKRLRVYPGAEHAHEAQQPVAVEEN